MRRPVLKQLWLKIVLALFIWAALIALMALLGII